MNLRFTRRRFVTLLARLPVAISAAYFGICARLLSADGEGRLTPDQLATLERVAWLLYPLPELGREPYARTANAIAEGAGAQLELLRSGIATLDSRGAFTGLSEAEQLARLSEIEQGEFFQYLLPAVRGRLWDDREVWALIGYEGSSMEFGGYLNKGLADIDWLPGKR